MKTIKVQLQLIDGKCINLDLYPDLAPITVENFLKLVKSNFYKNLIFHRVINGFMIQGGGLDQNMVEKEAPNTIKGEFSVNGWNKNTTTLSHEPGVVSMARTSILDSASSQFFIVTGDAKFLDGQYASFGKVSDEKSMDIVKDIEKVKTMSKSYHDDVPIDPIIIKTITILE